MLSLKQLKEIKSHLEKAQNPIFFFDNDADGLCSFLILQRYNQRGKGVPIRSFPDLTVEYFRKVSELSADYIFILDKPVVSKEFFEEAEKINIPVVWIDHHSAVMEDIPEFVNYYNPVMGKEASNEPTTYLAYKATQKKEDLWLAVAGCVSDKFIPDFYDEFCEDYPEMAVKTKDAFDILYKSSLGKIIKIFSFGLKDRVTNVILMLKFLMNVKSPTEVLEDGKKNHVMHLRYDQISRKYQKLVEKAKDVSDDKILFFQYGGDLSISSDLANELSYKFPKKIIVVIYITGARANISARGKNVKKLILDAISQLEGSTGGGHDDAVGARIKIEDLEKFRELLEKNA